MSGRVVVVTGASKGIGAAIAEAFAEEGGTVVVHYGHDRDGAEGVAALVRTRGATAHVMGADLATELGCTQLAEQVHHLVDRLDVLVNNAGAVPKPDTAREFELSHWQQVIATNVFSMTKLTALLLPLLRRGRNPSVINLSSIVARSAGFRSCAYIASKGAIDMLTRFQASELAPQIRVNALAPGHVATAIQKDETAEELETAIKLTPLARSATTAEIAQAALFLANNAFVTGLHLPVNGGLWMQ